MSLLPEIEDGKIVPQKEAKLYTPPKFVKQKSDEKRQEELNNLGRSRLTEDFSDSPHLNK